MAKKVNIKADAIDMAKEMRELFPKGVRSGYTNWRIGPLEGACRLEELFNHIGSRLDKSIVLEATKRYVGSFNGDYTYMRAMKYFIYKNDGGEFKSDLLTFVEDEDQGKQQPRFIDNDMV